MCNSCHRGFVSKKYLEMHTKSCMSSMNAQIEMLSKQIQEIRENTNKHAMTSLEFNDSEDGVHFKGQHQCHLKGQQQHTTQHNTINNITNNITINLNSFGSEDRSYLKNELIKECYDNLHIIPLIKDVYFNADHPENHTIKLKSEKKKRVLIHEGDCKWNECDMNSSIDAMMQLEHNKITKHFYDVIWPDPSIDFDRKSFVQRQIMKLNDKNIRFFQLRRTVQALLKSFEKNDDINQKNI